MYPYYLTVVLLLFYLSPLPAQQVANKIAAKQIDSTAKLLQHIPEKFLSQTEHKLSHFEKKVSKRTEKALVQLTRQEKKMQTKLARIDSVAAKNFFTRSIDSLGRLKSRLHVKTGNLQLPAAGAYTGYLDTLQNSLSFLKQAKNFGGQSRALQEKLSGSLQNLKELQSKLQQAEQIKAYIRERRQQMKAQLTQYAGFAKDLQKFNKRAYYYSQQIKEYKELLNNKKKTEAQALELLKKVPAYKSFLQKNSQLASLFNLSATGNTDQNLEGLQTCSQVEQLIQQRLGAGGPGARAAVSQQMAQAREHFNKLKSKFPDLDNTADMPDFKPNEMKSKRFLQRLEFGGNLQFQRSTQYFPNTCDIAGQVAYKFHKNGSLGLGTAFRLGMGTRFENIRFSSQGIGLRSFLDWKLKGSVYLNGGFEQNYNNNIQYSQRSTEVNRWQRSALIGISKKYKINNKLKGNIILLYDFLYSQYAQRTSPIKLRLGYTL